MRHYKGAESQKNIKNIKNVLTKHILCDKITTEKVLLCNICLNLTLSKENGKMKYIAPEYIYNRVETEDVITGSGIFEIIKDAIVGEDENGDPIYGQKGEYSVDIGDLLG